MITALLIGAISVFTYQNTTDIHAIKRDQSALVQTVNQNMQDIELLGNHVAGKAKDGWRKHLTPIGTLE